MVLSLPGELSAQGAQRPIAAVVLGPGISIGRWPGQPSIVPQHDYLGFGVTGRIALPVAFEASVVGMTSLWGQGPKLQSVALTLEARPGTDHQLLAGFGPALVRQPYQDSVVWRADGTSPNLSNEHLSLRPGVYLSAGYARRIGDRLQAGPHWDLVYTVGGSRRFHVTRVGLLVGLGL